MSLRIPTVPLRIGETVLNGKINRINETLPGGTGQSPIPPATVGVGAAPGQIGVEFELDTDAALLLSDTSIGTLYAGVYQYVQLISTAPLAAVRGCAAFVVGITQAGIYQVTTDAATAANLAFPVGCFLNVVTQGNYCVIQTRGLATIQYATAVTNNLSGQPVKWENGSGGQAGLGVGQQLNTDFSTPTVLTMTPYLVAGMTAAELPVDGGLQRVWMRPIVRLV